MAWQESGMRVGLDMQLRQKLVMTPQLQQAIRLLQLSRMELSQEIELQMLENPLVEEVAADTPEEDSGEGPSLEEPASTDTDEERSESSEDIDLKWDNYYDDEERERIESDVTWEAPEEKPSFEATLARPVSLSDHLLWQLGLTALSDREKWIGGELIGNINDKGYLETPIEEIAHDLEEASPEEIEKVLRVIQEFDPAGVGAQNLVECLLIQIRILGCAGSLVETLIRNHIEAIEKRRYAQIARECNVSVEEVMQASKIIEHLEPKPARPFFSNDNFNIVPDVFVMKVYEKEKTEANEDGTSAQQEVTIPSALTPPNGTAPAGEEEGRYGVFLNDDGLPKVKISAYYQSLLKSKSTDAENPRAYLEDKYRSAVWFIRSIEQRNRTILKVAESILKFQYGFMQHGVRALKPLVLKQVAEDIEMHESTVSRVTTNKYMHTPQGIYELKFFFNGSLPAVEKDNAESLSSLAVREQIERMVANEDVRRPLTDQKIVEQLKQKGVEMARRTVSKYRAELKIAPASRRRRPG
jgi:RNA polymerase sigma-54 factor